MKIIKIIFFSIISLILVNFLVTKIFNINPILEIYYLLNPSTIPHGYSLKKPAIYLYPTATQKIKVTLDINGTITKTIPNYQNNWVITANPDGSLDNDLDYLFYEANLKKIEFPEESWVVNTKNINSWFTEYLPKFGLNQKETQQFKEYWLKELPKSEYLQISLLSTDFLNQNLKLNIEPKPDTVIRLNFIFKSLNQPIITNQPTIKTPLRPGFTVVEWGGILLN